MILRISRDYNSAEGFATTALLVGIWIFNLESAAHQCVLIVDHDAGEKTTVEVGYGDRDAVDIVELISLTFGAVDNLHVVQIT